MPSVIIADVIVPVVIVPLLFVMTALLAVLPVLLTKALPSTTNFPALVAPDAGTLTLTPPVPTTLVWVTTVAFAAGTANIAINETAKILFAVIIIIIPLFSCFSKSHFHFDVRRVRHDTHQLTLCINDQYLPNRMLLYHWHSLLLTRTHHQYLVSQE